MKKTTLLTSLLCASALVSLSACSKSNNSDKPKEVTVENAKWCSEQLTQDGTETVASLDEFKAAIDAQDGARYMGSLRKVTANCTALLKNYKASEFDCKMTIGGETDVLRYREVVKTCKTLNEELINQEKKAVETVNATSMPPTPTLNACKTDLQFQFGLFSDIYMKYESAKRSKDYLESHYKDKAGRKCNSILSKYSQYDFNCTLEIDNTALRLDYDQFRQLCDDLFAK